MSGQLTVAQLHDYAHALAFDLYPGCSIVEASFDDGAWTLLIDDPEDEFELARLHVSPDLSWDVG